MTDQQKETSSLGPDENPCREISDPAVLAKEPIVSVRMSTYNHEPYIAQAIEGVVTQETEYPFELIIGEDCSTDRTREIVFEYQKKYPDIIRVIAWDKNVGMRKNGRRAYMACRGKYIAICEGDDYWHHPGKLQKQIDFLENHPDYGMVHSDADYVVVETGKVTCNVNRSTNAIYNDDDSDLPWRILSCQYIVRVCTVCARKALIDEIIAANPFEFQGNHFLMGDIPCWFELARWAKVGYIDESLATRNALPESACKSKDIRKLIKFAKSSRELRMHYIRKYSHECSPQMEKIVIEDRNKLLLGLAYRAMDFKLARDAMSELRRIGADMKPSHHFMFYGSHPLLGFLVRPLLYGRRILSKIIRVLGRQT